MNRKQMLTAVVVLSLGILAGAVQALAQGPTLMEANVPFEFSIGDQTFPAGMYHFDLRGGSMMLRTKDRSVSATIPIITRLGSKNAAGTSLVFDKANGKHTLSEVWLSATDGFLVATTAEQHEHDIVK